MKPAQTALRAPLYFFEVTDTFGGEANFSWVTRHVIRAKTERGAINRFSRMSGMKWHGVGCERYDSASGATCYFFSRYDECEHGELRFDTDEREADEKNAYAVHVSNVGMVHRGYAKEQAEREFGEWCALANATQGRASGEEVTLLCNGETMLNQAAREGLNDE